ncbi:PHD finger protein, putative [Ixodes scapularis]|uniref:PHD finger protein, putative n=1 Tax=Ixodes scapularis TaxID=6945 RepID=B7PQM7_IXOSC|nr:PHD finger protein, putative [Ixodes scapularis]|eukprot:XP_002436069.1 PHD finger protein, putative [Ixodes scapularis]
MQPKESGTTSCLICACDMVSEPSPQVLITPCCQHSFHRACLQAQASSAGSYFFKCCICNNIDAFQKEMLDHGICIPQQKAAGVATSSPQSKRCDDDDNDSDIEVVAVVLRPKLSPLEVIILDDSDDSDLEDLCGCPRCYNF